MPLDSCFKFLFKVVSSEEEEGVTQASPRFDDDAQKLLDQIAANQRQQREIDDKNSEISRLGRERQQHLDQIRDQQAEINRLQRELQAANEAAQGARDQNEADVAAVRAELTEQHRIREQQLTDDSAARQLELDQALHERDENVAEVGRLRTSLLQTALRIGLLQRELRRRITAAETSVMNLQHQNQLQNDELERLRPAVEQHVQDIDQLRQENQLLRDQLAGREDLNLQVQELLRLIQQVRREKVVVQDENERLVNDYQLVRQQRIAAGQETETQRQQHLLEIQRHLSQIQDLNREVAELRIVTDAIKVDGQVPDVSLELPPGVQPPPDWRPESSVVVNSDGRQVREASRHNTPQDLWMAVVHRRAILYEHLARQGTDAIRIWQQMFDAQNAKIAALTREVDRYASATDPSEKRPTESLGNGIGAQDDQDEVDHVVPESRNHVEDLHATEHAKTLEKAQAIIVSLSQRWLEFYKAILQFDSSDEFKRRLTSLYAQKFKKEFFDALDHGLTIDDMRHAGNPQTQTPDHTPVTTPERRGGCLVLLRENAVPSGEISPPGSPPFLTDSSKARGGSPEVSSPDSHATVVHDGGDDDVVFGQLDEPLAEVGNEVGLARNDSPDLLFGEQMDSSEPEASVEPVCFSLSDVRGSSSSAPPRLPHERVLFGGVHERRTKSEPDRLGSEPDRTDRPYTTDSDYTSDDGPALGIPHDYPLKTPPPSPPQSRSPSDQLASLSVLSDDSTEPASSQEDISRNLSPVHDSRNRSPVRDSASLDRSRNPSPVRANEFPVPLALECQEGVNRPPLLQPQRSFELSPESSSQLGSPTCVTEQTVSAVPLTSITQSGELMGQKPSQSHEDALLCSISTNTGSHESSPPISPPRTPRQDLHGMKLLPPRTPQHNAQPGTEDLRPRNQSNGDPMEAGSGGGAEGSGFGLFGGGGGSRDRQSKQSSSSKSASVDSVMKLDFSSIISQCHELHNNPFSRSGRSVERTAHSVVHEFFHAHCAKETKRPRDRVRGSKSCDRNFPGSFYDQVPRRRNRGHSPHASMLQMNEQALHAASLKQSGAHRLDGTAVRLDIPYDALHDAINARALGSIAASFVQVPSHVTTEAHMHTNPLAFTKSPLPTSINLQTDVAIVFQSETVNNEHRLLSAKITVAIASKNDDTRSVENSQAPAAASNVSFDADAATLARFQKLFSEFHAGTGLTKEQLEEKLRKVALQAADHTRVLAAADSAGDNLKQLQKIFFSMIQ